MRKLYLFLLMISAASSLMAQTRCAEIESILVDACGSPEGRNEMFRFKIGPNDLNTADLAMQWSSNPWLGVCQDATTAQAVAALNRTITHCGWLVEPVGGVLPAGREVLFVTSENMDTLANSFSNLQDTLIIIFQCGNASTGHFKNYQAGAGSRTTIMNFTGVNGCSDTATYIVDSLIDQNGNHTAQDGATVNFTNSIATSYTNVGCNAPVPQTTVQILTPDTSICNGSDIPLTAIAGNYHHVKWYGGAGIFSSPDSLNTTYTPRTSEVYPLTLRLYAYQTCTGDSVGDSITISRFANNTTTVGNDTACPGVTVGLWASGGQSYAWDANSDLTCTSCPMPTVIGTGSGNYYVNITDAHGCIYRDTLSVSRYTTPVVSIDTPGTLSCGNNLVILTASSSNSGAAYHWNGGASGATYSVTTAGTYTVTMFDDDNCSASASVSVTSSSGTVSVTTASTAASCGNNNGTATVTPTSGSSPYSYVWNNSGTTPVISGLGAGTYTVTVTDNGGCSATASVSVTASNNLAITASAVSTSCGLSNGSVTVSPANGSSPFTYVWNTGGTSATLSNIAAGTYNVTVTDAGGCSATASAVVNTSGGTNVSVTSDKSIMCSGDTATICAPSGFVSYIWNTGETTMCIKTTLAGNYAVTVTDNGSCTASNHASVSVYPLPPVSISVNGDTLTSYNAVSYQWYLNGNMLSGATGDVYIAQQSGDYSIVITDTNGCRAHSNVVHVVVAGINDIEGGNTVSVFPNPAGTGNNWVLETNLAWLGGVCEIYDADGRLLYHKEITDIKSVIDLDVAAGVYFMRVYSAQNSYSIKLLKW